MNRDNFRAILKGLDGLGALEVRGEEYTGTQLAYQVAINPEVPIDEAARTPQLIFEMGRLCAAARAEFETVEASYLKWREELTLELLYDLEVAEGYDLAVTDSKGKVKCPPRATIDSFVRTTDDYQEWKAKMRRAEEIWSSLVGALDAAKARTRSIIVTDRSGGTAQPRVAANNGAGGGHTTYHGGYEEGGQAPQRESLSEAESWVGTTPTTPLPPPPAQTPGPPPLPSNDDQSAKPKRKAPPPPSRS